MQIIYNQDILELIGRVDAVCITTNTCTKTNGEAVMGAGIALAFAKKFPDLPRRLGQLLIQTRHAPIVHLLRYEGTTALVALPTKMDWKQPSNLEFVLDRCKDLKELANQMMWFKSIVLPPPGCGLGGIKWEQCCPILETILDNRFWITLNNNKQNNRR